MDRKLLSKPVAVLSFAFLLLALGASAQAPFASPSVKISNVIEGGTGGVSAARCGTGVVVGFGDMESGKAASYDGFSYSKTNGVSFSDGGTVSLGSPADFVGSGAGFYPSNLTTNPAIACSSATTFYYASAGSVGNPSCGGICTILNTSIAVSTSTDGGVHWSHPVEAAHQISDTETFLSPSIAIDPSNPSHLWIAYLHFSQNPNSIPGFLNCDQSGYFVRWVSSTNGGKTWSAPNISEPIDYSCGDGASAEHTGALGAPMILVSPAGAICVAYEFMKQEPFTGKAIRNEIRFSRSLNHGSTFSAPIIISTDAIASSPVELAVDRTKSRYRGSIYLAWSGKPSRTYTDVLVSDSLNSGASFSFPRAISPSPTANTGRYQADPVIAVDNDGVVAACFYETPRNQPGSSSVYSYHCGASSNHGATWQEQSIANSVPVGLNALTSDFLLHNDGFFSAYETFSSGKRYVMGRSGDAN